MTFIVNYDTDDQSGKEPLSVHVGKPEKPVKQPHGGEKQTTTETIPKAGESIMYVVNYEEPFGSKNKKKKAYRTESETEEVPDKPETLGQDVTYIVNYYGLTDEKKKFKSPSQIESVSDANADLDAVDSRTYVVNYDSFVKTGSGRQKRDKKSKPTPAVVKAESDTDAHTDAAATTSTFIVNYETEPSVWRKKEISPVIDDCLRIDAAEDDANEFTFVVKHEKDDEHSKEKEKSVSSPTVIVTEAPEFEETTYQGPEFGDETMTYVVEYDRDTDKNVDKITTERKDIGPSVTKTDDITSPEESLSFVVNYEDVKKKTVKAKEPVEGEPSHWLDSITFVVEKDDIDTAKKPAKPVKEKKREKPTGVETVTYVIDKDIKDTDANITGAVTKDVDNLPAPEGANEITFIVNYETPSKKVSPESVDAGVPTPATVADSKTVTYVVRHYDNAGAIIEPVSETTGVKGEDKAKKETHGKEQQKGVETITFIVNQDELVKTSADVPLPKISKAGKKKQKQKPSEEPITATFIVNYDDITPKRKRKVDLIPKAEIKLEDITIPTGPEGTGEPESKTYIHYDEPSFEKPHIEKVTPEPQIKDDSMKFDIHYDVPQVIVDTSHDDHVVEIINVKLPKETDDYLVEVTPEPRAEDDSMKFDIHYDVPQVIVDTSHDDRTREISDVKLPKETDDYLVELTPEPRAEDDSMKFDIHYDVPQVIVDTTRDDHAREKSDVKLPKATEQQEFEIKYLPTTPESLEVDSAYATIEKPQLPTKISIHAPETDLHIDDKESDVSPESFTYTVNWDKSEIELPKQSGSSKGEIKKDVLKNFENESLTFIVNQDLPVKKSTKKIAKSKDKENLEKIGTIEPSVETATVTFVVNYDEPFGKSVAAVKKPDRLSKSKNKKSKKDVSSSESPQKDTTEEGPSSLVIHVQPPTPDSKVITDISGESVDIRTKTDDVIIPEGEPPAMIIHVEHPQDIVTDSELVVIHSVVRHDEPSHIQAENVQINVKVKPVPKVRLSDIDLVDASVEPHPRTDDTLTFKVDYDKPSIDSSLPSKKKDKKEVVAVDPRFVNETPSDVIHTFVVNYDDPRMDTSGKKPKQRISTELVQGNEDSPAPVTFVVKHDEPVEKVVQTEEPDSSLIITVEHPSLPAESEVINIPDTGTTGASITYIVESDRKEFVKKTKTKSGGKVSPGALELKFENPIIFETKSKKVVPLPNVEPGAVTEIKFENPVTIERKTKKVVPLRDVEPGAVTEIKFENPIIIETKTKKVVPLPDVEPGAVTEIKFENPVTIERKTKKVVPLPDVEPGAVTEIKFEHPVTIERKTKKVVPLPDVEPGAVTEIKFEHPVTIERKTKKVVPLPDVEPGAVTEIKFEHPVTIERKTKKVVPLPDVEPGAVTEIKFEHPVTIERKTKKVVPLPDVEPGAVTEIKFEHPVTIERKTKKVVPLPDVEPGAVTEIKFEHPVIIETETKEVSPLPDVEPGAITEIKFEHPVIIETETKKVSPVPDVEPGAVTEIKFEHPVIIETKTKEVVPLPDIEPGAVTEIKFEHPVIIETETKEVSPLPDVEPGAITEIKFEHPVIIETETKEVVPLPDVEPGAVTEIKFEHPVIIETKTKEVSPVPDVETGVATEIKFENPITIETKTKVVVPSPSVEPETITFIVNQDLPLIGDTSKEGKKKSKPSKKEKDSNVSEKVGSVVPASPDEVAVDVSSGPSGNEITYIVTYDEKPLPAVSGKDKKLLEEEPSGGEMQFNTEDKTLELPGRRADISGKVADESLTYVVEYDETANKEKKQIEPVSVKSKQAGNEEIETEKPASKTDDIPEEVTFVVNYDESFGKGVFKQEVVESDKLKDKTEKKFKFSLPGKKAKLKDKEDKVQPEVKELEELQETITFIVNDDEQVQPKVVGTKGWKFPKLKLGKKKDSKEPKTKKSKWNFFGKAKGEIKTPEVKIEIDEGKPVPPHEEIKPDAGEQRKPETESEKQEITVVVPSAEIIELPPTGEASIKPSVDIERPSATVFDIKDRKPFETPTGQISVKVEGPKLPRQIAVVKPEMAKVTPSVDDNWPHCILVPVADLKLEQSSSIDDLLKTNDNFGSIPQVAPEINVLLSEKLQQRTSKNLPYFVVVAIDFGTTFSGYAFSFAWDSAGSIHIMRKWEGGDPGAIDHKTPTSLLLTPEGKFHSFGFTARDFFHDLSPKEAKKWLYFEKFKMALHHSLVSRVLETI